jgi:hypothetical protein
MNRENFKRVAEIHQALSEIEDWQNKLNAAEEHHPRTGCKIAIFPNGDGYAASTYRLDVVAQSMLYGYIRTDLDVKEKKLLEELETL